VARAKVPTRASLSNLTVGELLLLYRRILADLRRREVIRSGNAPAGDYAEWLVWRATGGQLAPNSQKSWDIETPESERLQVKARLVINPRRHGERQLSVFRSWKFDAAVIVLFDDEFRVWQAARIPMKTIKANARFLEHVNGHRVHATDDLLALGEDWTNRLLAVIEGA
jgi:hypothetical protein